MSTYATPKMHAVNDPIMRLGGGNEKSRTRAPVTREQAVWQIAELDEPQERRCPQNLS